MAPLDMLHQADRTHLALAVTASDASAQPATVDDITVFSVIAGSRSRMSKRVQLHIVRDEGHYLDTCVYTTLPGLRVDGGAVTSARLDLRIVCEPVNFIEWVQSMWSWERALAVSDIAVAIAPTSQMARLEAPEHPDFDCLSFEGDARLDARVSQDAQACIAKLCDLDSYAELGRYTPMMDVASVLTVPSDTLRVLTDAQILDCRITIFWDLEYAVRLDAIRVRASFNLVNGKLDVNQPPRLCNPANLSKLEVPMWGGGERIPDLTRVCSLDFGSPTSRALCV